MAWLDGLKRQLRALWRALLRTFGAGRRGPDALPQGRSELSPRTPAAGTKAARTPRPGLIPAASDPRGGKNGVSQVSTPDGESAALTGPEAQLRGMRGVPTWHLDPPDEPRERAESALVAHERDEDPAAGGRRGAGARG